MGQKVGSLFRRCLSQIPGLDANQESDRRHQPPDAQIVTALVWFRTDSFLSSLMSRFCRLMGQPTPEQNWTKACDAIARNNVHELKNLLQESNLDPNFASLTNMSLLLPDVQLRTLVTEYANTDQLKVNPLHVSILMRNKVAADLLLQNGADPFVGPAARTGTHTRSTTQPVCTAVHFAVICDEFPILKSLVDHAEGDADLLKERDQYNLTALDQALKFRSRNCALLLIQAGAYIAMDTNNTSILTICGDLLTKSFDRRDQQLLSRVLDCDYAAGGDVMAAFLNIMTIDDKCRDSIKVFDKIVARSDFSAGSRCGPERSNYLHLAARTQCVSVLKTLSALSVKVETNVCGENPLHIAVRVDRNTLSCIQYLISQGCDIDQADASGCTPLLAAVDAGNTTAILCLLDAGCKLPVTPLGYSFLHLYCNSGGTDLTVIQKLSHHCDVNAKTKFDWTALHFVVDRCQSNTQTIAIRAISELIRLGADPLLQNSAEDTILSLAVIRGHVLLIQELISGSVIEQGTVMQLLRTPDSAGQTPLHIAVQNPFIQQQTVMQLISQGSDVNASDKKGRTTLFFLLATEYSARSDDGRGIHMPPDPLREFRLLLQRRNILSCPSYGSFLPLRMWKILDHLLTTTDIDINCELTQVNETPLNIAFFRGEYNLMKKLLTASADVSRLNGSKFRPHPGMLSICVDLDAVGFDDFDPVYAILMVAKMDKFRMQMMNPVDRQEFLRLEDFLVKRKDRAGHGSSSIHKQ